MTSGRIVSHLAIKNDSSAILVKRADFVIVHGMHAGLD